MSTSKYLKDVVLVVDDEPQHLDWFEEYLAAKGCTVQWATNLGDADRLLRETRFRMVVVDLNIPSPESFSTVLAEKGDAYVNFPGLYAAFQARNFGHDRMQVIIYSVHESALVVAQAKVLDCVYILKGRPRNFKDQVERVLSFDPRAS